MRRTLSALGLAGALLAAAVAVPAMSASAKPEAASGTAPDAAPPAPPARSRAAHPPRVNGPPGAGGDRPEH
ncbi:hypothetical protein AB0C00_21860, partial [Micromonospora carbonacea]